MPYRISESAVNQKVGEELVILDLESGNYFGLDEVGARMVELIGEHSEVGSVVELLVQEYDAPVEQIRSDLEALLEELIGHGLVVRSD